jgi:hypothetical protein
VGMMMFHEIFCNDLDLIYHDDTFLCLRYIFLRFFGDFIGFMGYGRYSGAGRYPILDSFIDELCISYLN